jgi:hypothetical protein
MDFPSFKQPQVSITTPPSGKPHDSIKLPSGPKLPSPTPPNFPPQQIDIGTDDHPHIRPLPGGRPIVDLPPGIFKTGPEGIIDDALNFALTAKTPMARQMAMRDVLSEAKGMTPGQLDDFKDAIVKRMASDDSSQRERDVLKMMYDVVDAVSENRPVPPHLVSEPHRPFVKPPRVPMGEPGIPNIELHHSRPNKMMEELQLGQGLQEEIHELKKQLD